MAAKISSLSTTFTDPIDGQLIQRQTSLTKTIKDITAINVKLQTHVDAFKVQLQRQFTTMENLISKFNTIGTFLTNSPPGIFNNGATK
jgi:flagellar capping protein FliD